MVYWSASLLRDTIANFFFLCYMLLLMVFIEHGRKRALLAALMSVIMLSLFKEKIIVLLGSGFIFVSASYLMGKVFKMKLLTASLTTILILTVTLVAMLNNWDAVARHLQDKAVSMLAHHQTYSTENPEASTYKIFKESIYETKELHPRDLIDISLGFSIFAGLAYYFLSPFPWYVPYGHLGLLVFYPQVILTFIFLPFMALGVLISARRNLYMTAVTVVLIAMIAVPQALAEGIIGNVVRHRDMFMPFLIIFATYGFCSIFHSRSATAGC